ncbi:MAG: hypothetical protein ACRYGR_01610 [Janthinobacterium lividum]
MGSGGGGKGGSANQVTGYKYYMSVHMGVCYGPVNALVETRVGDREVWPYPEVVNTDGTVGTTGQPVTNVDDGTPNEQEPTNDTGITSSQTINIVADNVFGGDSSEGGINGQLAVMMGAATETPPSWVLAKFGSLVPAFRNVLTLFFDGLVCQNNPYPKTWKHRVRRTTAGWDMDNCWYPFKATIVQIMRGDQEVHTMNPAHILYECATNPDWGRGFDRSLMDNDAFEYCADTLYTENFGLNLKYDGSTPLDAFIQTVVDHISGAIFQDRRTGLITMRLARFDYDVTTLPTYSYGNGLISVQTDAVGTASTVPGEVVVKYHDQVYDMDATVRAHNLAVLQTQGGTSSVTTTYEGVTQPEMAYSLAVRDLKFQGASLRKLVLKMDRRMFSAAPFDVFIISIPERSIASMVVRVGKVEDGSNEDGSITVSVAEDVFGMSYTAFVQNQLTMWIPPDRSAKVPAAQDVLEMPFCTLVETLGKQTAVDVESSCRVLVLMARPSFLSLSGDIYSHIQGETDFTYRGQTDFTPVGKTLTNLGAYDTEVLLGSEIDLYRVIPGKAALLGGYADGGIGEIVQIVAVNEITNIVTLLRGCGDTYPQVWPLGTLLWFYADFANSDFRDYEENELCYLKFCTRTSSEVVSVDDVSQMGITLQKRAFRPYPPAALAINSTAFQYMQGANLHGGADGVMAYFTWAHRNRLLQQDKLIAYNDSTSVTPEDGTTYIISVFKSDGVTLLRTTNVGLTNIWAYTVAMYQADGAVGTTVFSVYSMRDGYNCFEIPLITLNFS